MDCRDSHDRRDSVIALVSSTESYLIVATSYIKR